MIKALLFVPSKPDFLEKLREHEIEAIVCRTLEELESKLAADDEIIAVVECFDENCTEVCQITRMCTNNIIVITSNINYGHTLRHFNNNSASILELIDDVPELVTFIERIYQSVHEQSAGLWSELGLDVDY